MANDHLKLPKCPLCPRVRRADRPLCTTHFAHAGTQTVHRYFVRAKAVRNNPNNAEAAERLAQVVDQLTHNARTYDSIRRGGYRPFWNAERQEWQHPVRRTAAILAAWVRNHRFGLDAANDANVIERIANEIHPQEPRK